MSKPDKKQSFQIIKEPHYIGKKPIIIESSSRLPSCCLHCSSPLSQGYCLIPLNKKEKAKIPGLECKTCKTLFVKQAEPIFRIIQGNTFAKDVVLNGYSFNEPFLQKKQKEQHQLEQIRQQKEQEKRKQAFLESIRQERELLSKIDGGILLATLKSKDSEIYCAITTKNAIEHLENKIRVFRYTDSTALKILTSIFHSPQNIEIDGKEYRISQVYPRNELGKVDLLPNRIQPNEMILKSGGGYYSAFAAPYEELVDVLLFSPITKQFEIMHATYNSITQKCYVDVRIFRSFACKYGKPKDIRFIFDSQKSISNGSGFENLNEVSPLREYGYSVSKKERLREIERHALLSEMVDLELLTVSQIVNYLNSFIRSHSADCYIYSRECWENDIRFITNYKVNPKRFLMVVA